MGWQKQSQQGKTFGLGLTEMERCDPDIEMFYERVSSKPPLSNVYVASRRRTLILADTTPWAVSARKRTMIMAVIKSEKTLMSRMKTAWVRENQSLEITGYPQYNVAGVSMILQ